MPSSNKYQVDSQNIAATVMRYEENYKLPSKIATVIKTFLYLVSNLFFIIVFVINFEILRDVIEYNIPQLPLEFFHAFYQNGLILGTTIIIWLTISFQGDYARGRFPSLVTLTGIFYNDVVCILFSVLVYYLDVRNIYFAYQIVLVIPIITIFLSSTFILDDCIELLSGKFVIFKDKPGKNKKRKGPKGELQPTDQPEPTEFVDLTPNIEEHNIIAANAALLAIPELNTKGHHGKAKSGKKDNTNEAK